MNFRQLCQLAERLFVSAPVPYVMRDGVAYHYSTMEAAKEAVSSLAFCDVATCLLSAKDQTIGDVVVGKGHRVEECLRLTLASAVSRELRRDNDTRKEDEWRFKQATEAERKPRVT